MQIINDSIRDVVQEGEAKAFSCPKCNSKTAFGQVCICGYGTQDSLVTLVEKNNRTIYSAYVVFSLILILSYMHILNWGPFALEVPALKAQHYLGVLNSKGYSKLAQACVARGKEQCAKQAYIDMFNRTKDVEALALLAQIETRTHEPEVAAKTYEAYYKKGGKNPRVALQYALLLEQLHKYDASIHYFRLSIQQNPDTLAVFATGELLRILMAQQKYTKAQSLIESFWASAENAKGYFNTEAAQLKKYVRPVKSRKIA